MEDQFVYRLATQAQWRQSRETGEIVKTALDKRDGFIHLSTAGQLVLTANMHFISEEVLQVLLFERDRIARGLKWENVPGRWDQMPHYYGDLYMKDVCKSLTMDRNPGGSFGIPTKGVI
ncbi:DUF952 domain-containing protein [Parvularcula sp. IMCC14364]|uniref:DUF952 domain-containing protein n=1 Tax=Parvularcula sp. IMCC14364 TaxID=3067902 RepID=UPI0027415958|nr:DUF952 domain-containing protein [Parvularcula sp. IMCC14364]